MIVSTNRFFRGCAFAVAVIILTGSVSAQDSETEAPPAPPPPAIAVDTLEAPRAVGLVDMSGGGFADTLWQGTPAETAQALVNGLPHRYTVPAARRLAERFLLSGVPVAGTVNGTDGNEALLKARILALAKMASWDDALALIDLMPASVRGAELRRVRISGLLVRGRIEAACGEAAHALTQSSDPFWQKVRVLCQFAAEQNSAAAVTLELLREQGEDDKAFQWAVEILLGGGSAPPEGIATPDGAVNPLALALLRQAAYPLPASLVAHGDPTVLTFAGQIAAARSAQPLKPIDESLYAAAEELLAKPDAAADELRLATIESAVAAGLAGADFLRVAYAAFAFTDDGSVAHDRIAVDDARARAATYQLALAQNNPAARAEVIARVMDLTRLSATTDTDMITTALLYEAMVAELPVAADLMWFAGTAVRILVVAESAAAVPAADGGMARKWIDFLATAANPPPVEGLAADPALSEPTDGTPVPLTAAVGAPEPAVSPEEARTVLASLWPYTRLSRLDDRPLDGADVEAWRATLAGEDSRRTWQKSVDAFDLMGAVGDRISTLWQPLLTRIPQSSRNGGGVLPAPVVWNALDAASRDGRVGETVALALQLLGGGQKGQAAVAVTKALGSLAAVGRAADARAVALELALERGL